MDFKAAIMETINQLEKDLTSARRAGGSSLTPDDATQFRALRKAAETEKDQTTLAMMHRILSEELAKAAGEDPSKHPVKVRMRDGTVKEFKSVDEALAYANEQPGTAPTKGYSTGHDVAGDEPPPPRRRRKGS